MKHFFKAAASLLPLSTFSLLTFADTPPPLISTSSNNNTLAEQLGWISTPASSANVCGGHYDLSQFPAPSPISIQDAPAKIEAPPPVNYQVNGNAEFNNGVTITQPGRTLYADHAVITPNLKTGQLDSIAADGNIRITQPGELILAKSMQANLVNHQATVDEVTYLIAVGETSPSLQASQPDESSVFTGFAHGAATNAKQTNATNFSLHNATYSTCSPETRTWELDASSIDIDQAIGQGSAYNTVLKVHGFPVFYLPYFNFPTNSARKSGFLYGNIMSSSQSGLALTVPYYFNLAPNYDYTLTPTIYSKDGILLDNNFRFLTASSSGNIDAQLVPYDQEYGQGMRYMYTINDTTNFTNNFNATLNYNAVSDDNYLQDFSVLNADQVLLNRSLSTAYQSPHWTVSGVVQSYQIVNSTLTTENRPYNELPEINATGEYPNFAGPLSFSLNSDIANFSKQPATVYEVSPVTGERISLTPTFSIPLTQSYGYITPSLGFDSTDYSLQNAEENGFNNNTPGINVPIASLDTGLYFDRNFTFDNHSYTQTLAPRLYYLYVPYQNQNDIPIFDTTIIPFSFSQLFTNNSFSGYDRIQNANQLAYALSSNINNAEGQQILNGGIGQIWYFANRNVSLCQNQPGQPPCIQIENPDYQQNFSDVAAYGSYNINSAWSLTANLTFNPYSTLLDSQEYTVSYTPNSMDVINVSYQNNRQNYSLLSNQQILQGTPPLPSSIINTSFILGFTPQWASFGSFNYSIENSGPIAEFVGIQYSSCCWAIRLGDYRYVTNSNPNTPNILTGQMTNAVLLQFLLKGLGGVSSGSINSLLASIPTYHGQLGF